MLSGTSSTVTNCTFSGNSGGWRGGAIYGDSPTLINNIFWNNTAERGPQIALDDARDASISYCDIQGGRDEIYIDDHPSGLDWGPGNIDVDPMFVDADGPDDVAGTADDNLRLLAGSPCIDAGDNAALPPSVVTDLDGNPRIVGMGVDMGAYEFQVLHVLYVDADATGNNDGTSWLHAFADLQNALGTAAASPELEEIRVAEGVYTPAGSGGSRAASFNLVDGVGLLGGYAGYGHPNPNSRDVAAYETVLSGDLNRNDVAVDDPRDLLSEPTRAENSYHVIIGGQSVATTVLDGFTVSGGNANNQSGSSPDYQDCGGGIYNSEVTVIDCTLRDNSCSTTVAERFRASPIPS